MQHLVNALVLVDPRSEKLVMLAGGLMAQSPPGSSKMMFPPCSSKHSSLAKQARPLKASFLTLRSGTSGMTLKAPRRDEGEDAGSSTAMWPVKLQTWMEPHMSSCLGTTKMELLHKTALPRLEGNRAKLQLRKMERQVIPMTATGTAQKTQSTLMEHLNQRMVLRRSEK